MPKFEPGARIIYRRIHNRTVTEEPAKFIREQIINGRVMYVISVDSAPKPRQVGVASVSEAL